MKNQQTTLLTLSVIGLLCLIIGFAFIIWQTTSNNSDEITNECYKITYANAEDSLKLASSNPISDEKGLKTTPYSFSVQNTCDSQKEFSINLEITKSSAIPLEHLKITLNSNTPKTLITANQTNTTTEDTISYQLTTDAIPAKSTTTYDLQIWLNEAADQSNYTLEAKITVIPIPNEDAAVNKRIIVDGTESENYPDSEYYTLQSLTCTNNAFAIWDTYYWTLTTSSSKEAECTITFQSNNLASSFIKNLYPKNTSTMNKSDPDGNIRYMGSNPNNYITIGGELWRIIGVFDIASNKADYIAGATQSRLKIIRAESLPAHSWDSSSNTPNENLGHGINEWSQADLKKTLNEGAYLNATTSECPTYLSNTLTPCDFTKTGLSSEAKNFLDDAYWLLGTTPNTWELNQQNRTETASQMYQYERTTQNTAKKCQQNTAYCSDTIERQTSWQGKVGLIYPSDYAYATTGGTTTNHSTCLSTPLSTWHTLGLESCKNNSWLLPTTTEWTITPLSYTAYASKVITISQTGQIDQTNAATALPFRPVVYLSSKTRITGGKGTKEKPYTCII